MLDAAFALGEHLQLTLWTVHQLLVGSVRPLHRNLRILLPVGHEERHADALDHSVEVDALGDRHELVHIPGAPDPADVCPVVRHREIAFALAAPLLHVPPVVIGAPGHTAREARLERDGARAEIAAERHTFHPDPLRVHVVSRFQPIDDAAGPVFAVEARWHAEQAERLAGAGLIDHQRRDPALPRARPADRRGSASPLSNRGRSPAPGPARVRIRRRRERTGLRDVSPSYGNLDALAVLVREASCPRRTRPAPGDRAPAVPARRAPAGARRSAGRWPPD